MELIGQSPNELIEILNRRNAKSKLEYIEIIKDTIAIRIINDEYLSEQMETSGAHCYLGESALH